jgi:hypothetical protein
MGGWLPELIRHYLPYRKSKNCGRSRWRAAHDLRISRKGGDAEFQRILGVVVRGMVN